MSPSRMAINPAGDKLYTLQSFWTVETFTGNLPAWRPVDHLPGSGADATSPGSGLGTCPSSFLEQCAFALNEFDQIIYHHANTLSRLNVASGQ
jgi:hypothetical protein